MNISVGPFDLLYLILFIIIINVIGLYIIFKRKLGIEAIVVLFIFPIVGFMALFLFELRQKKKTQ